jgi:hypothetical protein
MSEEFENIMEEFSVEEVKKEDWKKKRNARGG